MSRRRAALQRLHFFGGKGGTGKTTLSAATAWAAARDGERVLVVSTDPAHSLADALRLPLSGAPRVVPGSGGRLRAVEIDADAALARWLRPRRRALRELARRGTFLDDADVDRILGLTLPGVDEILGLVELARLARERPFDRVVVDTAPTGHALRLLETPDTLRAMAGVLDDLNAKHRLLVGRFAGRARADPAQALVDEIDAEARTLLERLGDPAQTRFDWLLLPEALALEEARDGLAALRSRGLPLGDAIVNRLTPAPVGSCRLCDARRRAEAAIVATARRDLTPFLLTGRLRLLGAADDEPRGRAALLRLAGRLASGDFRPARAGRAPAPARRAAATIGALAGIAARPTRLLMFAGKGGVGKTTCACVAALDAARREPARRVLLISSDPAHSLGDALEAALGDTPARVAGAPTNLTAREIDSGAAFARLRDSYRASVEQAFAAWLRGGIDPAHDRAVMRELIDLAPPGLDELLALVSLVDALEDGAEPLVVLDSAPTGHALRVLTLPDAALQWVHAALELLLKYHSEAHDLARELLQAARRLRALRALLRDASVCRVIAVTRPAALPRQETKRLVSRLRRLRIGVSGLVVNAVTPPGCARCRREAARDAREVRTLTAETRPLLRRGVPLLIAPLVAPPPRGPAALSTWGAAWTRMVP